LYTGTNQQEGVRQVKVKLSAEPEPIEIDPERSALIVIDMQNFDISPGGFFDLTDVDTTHGQKVIAPIQTVSGAARRAGLPVLYTKNVIPADPALWPDEDSPWYRKGDFRKLAAANPELRRGHCLDGEWGAEIVDDLAPAPGDLVIEKATYSGFVNTSLDVVLRRKGVRYLFITGIGTPTCVEATARDAYFREYWPILISDCCGAIFPETHEAALFAIKRRYGWATTSADFLGALRTAGQPG
jgi:ureidoacrylate peracid hydrolase